MECPVCHHKQVEEDALNCPNCNSNLQGFRVLDIIEQEQKRWKIMLYILGGFLLFIIAVWAMRDQLIEEGVSMDKTSLYKDSLALQRSEIEGLSSEVQSLKESNAQMAEQIKEFEVIEMAVEGESLEKDYHVHIVKQGESLWSIAEKYHDDGFKHEEIAGHNELNDPHFIEVGDTVIIKK
ncbi:MAG: LysM peptidoglycan-binding domain-containing protein [Flavobacteriales bacterium]|jgi:LysM repeat protein|tara:strand:- start:1003 stop:1542 length:540 start_codon:yes stop_codon:yes gene_type:complete